jgi:hypothetical protein
VDTEGEQNQLNRLNGKIKWRKNMKTLLEYMTFVKGMEYLIVIAFCFAFIALWILVHSKEKAALSRVVSIVLPLSLVFGGGAVVLSASDTPDLWRQ